MKDEQIDQIGKKIQYSEWKQRDQPEKWIQKAIKKPGALRSALGAKEGKPIPDSNWKAAMELHIPNNQWMLHQAPVRNAVNSFMAAFDAP